MVCLYLKADSQFFREGSPHLEPELTMSFPTLKASLGIEYYGVVVLEFRVFGINQTHRNRGVILSFVPVTAECRGSVSRSKKSQLSRAFRFLRSPVSISKLKLAHDSEAPK